MVVVVPETDTTAIPDDVSAFSDFLDLRTAVIENVGRPDIADVFPRLVALAEARLNRKLRTHMQIETRDVSLVDGRADLPSNLAEILSVNAANGGEYLQQSPQFVSKNLGVGSYAIEADQMVGPIATGDVSVMYYAELPPLSAVTDTNWLLQKYPDVYLYGVAFEAAKYIRDVELAQINQTLLSEAIDEIRADDTRTRFSRARVRVSGPTP